MSRRNAIILIMLAALFSVAAGIFFYVQTSARQETLRTLWLASLPPLPPDPSNQYADSPLAAALGKQLFFDTRFSANGQVACATCHIPEEGFQDGLPLAEGIGTTKRRTMPIAGTAYSPWMFWDGRKDSQWAQALAPLESPVEHGASRMAYAHLVDQYYRPDYEAIFGALPDFSDPGRFPAAASPSTSPEEKAAWDAMTPADRSAVTRVFVNLGKAIAAYERRVMPSPSRFDQYLQIKLAGAPASAEGTLTRLELEGLHLFIGAAQCIRCHNGPLFTDHSFHNTGIAALPNSRPDSGRAEGASLVVTDEFNCLSTYSDAEAQQCSELRFIRSEGSELNQAFKTPSLRNVAKRAPYMHAGQFETLEAVLEHYNNPPAGTELEPLHLNPRQIKSLLAFLKTINSPITAP